MVMRDPEPVATVAPGGAGAGVGAGAGAGVLQVEVNLTDPVEPEGPPAA